MMSDRDTQPNDSDLVQASLSDPESYGAIIRKYSPLLGRYLWRLGVGDEHDRKDLLQEIFIKAYLNLNEYDQDLAFSSWIYRIGHNESVSFFRKKSVRPQTTSIDEYEGLPMPNLIVDDLPNAFDTALTKRSLLEMIYTLDQKYQEVLILNYFEEKSYDEIADILKKPPGTIATLISRAKAKLKILLLTHPHVYP
jgi:RNA polymerase sigma-70 factor (ECF subfamily)